MSVAHHVVRRPVLVVVVFALIMIVSLYTLTDISLDFMPDIDRPVLMITASYAGASPESVEKSVTTVLESSLVNVSGLKKLSSSSGEGSSRIELEFSYGTDLDTAVNDIRDKLDRVRSSLPDGCDSPSVFQFSVNDLPIMKIMVAGNRAPEELKVIAEDIIQPRFEQVDGIARADVTGGRKSIIRAELSQNRLDAYGLTITGLASKLAAANVELGGGSIEEGTRNYLIRTSGEYSSIGEIAGTVVASLDGYDVKLSDLGNVTNGYEDESSIVYVNGEPGVYVSLTKRSGSNSVKAADAIYEKIGQVKELLPSDVTMRIVSDDTTSIRGTLNNLLGSILQGAGLAMAIIFLFLRSWKSTLIIGISIPFSLLVTLLCMSFAGITLNMMTMTGLILGVGMIVDASIVILENIHQYRERGTKAAIAAIIGSQEMTASILAGNLTTIVVFVPILFFKSKLGMIGMLFGDIIFTIIISILSSFFVAIFLVPVLASKYLKLTSRGDKPLKNKILLRLDGAFERAFGGLERAYEKILRVALGHRLAVVLIVVGSLVLSLSFIPTMNINLMPGFSDSSITLSIELPLGATLAETKQVVLRMEAHAMKELKGVDSIIATVGSGGGAGGNTATYKGEISITLPDFARQVDNASAMQSKLSGHFGEFPNAVFSFSQGRMQQMMGGSDIDVAIGTQDLDEGISMARTLTGLLDDKIPDLEGIAMDITVGLPQVNVVVDRSRAYAFGVSVQSVATEIDASIDGIVATTYRAKGNEYSVVLFLQPSDRKKVPDLERIFVQGANGRVAVANFARLEKGVGPVSISRNNQRRTIHVTANISSSRRAGDIEEDIKNVIAANVVLPDGVSLSYEGSWADIRETGYYFMLIISMALLLVFGVMAGQYESWKDPFINMFTIPFLIIGVLLVYVISGETLSMFTAMGVVMLVGIVVNNGIILVDYTNLLVRRGMPVREACVSGGVSRLRPVLMTTLTTMLGLLPMAVSSGENSQMLKPIGLTVLGGLSSSTLITLLVIPVVYSFLNTGKKKRSAKSTICKEAVE